MKHIFSTLPAKQIPNPYVVGRISVPITFVPWGFSCEYVTSHGRMDFADVIKVINCPLCFRRLGTLKQEDYLGLSNVIPWALKSRDISPAGSRIWNQIFKAWEEFDGHCWLEEEGAILRKLEPSPVTLKQLNSANSLNELEGRIFSRVTRQESSPADTLISVL